MVAMPQKLDSLHVICDLPMPGDGHVQKYSSRNMTFKIQKHSVLMIQKHQEHIEYIQQYHTIYNTTFNEEHSRDELINEQSRISTFATMLLLVLTFISHCP